MTSPVLTPTAQTGALPVAPAERNLHAGLRVQRAPLASVTDGPLLLGGLCFDPRVPEGPVAGVALRPLNGDPAPADLWLGQGPVQAGAQGALRWRQDGHWLFGALDVDLDAAAAPDLATQVQQAYRVLFDNLQSTGMPHLLRVWNYLPRINDDEAGLERYRHFNLGRQQAFLAAQRAAFEGAPAACALGPHDGPFALRWLAGRCPVLPLENPRQVPAYHYPSDYGPRSPSFSRAALADAGGGQVLLLISGTASIVGHRSLHEGDLAGQLRETLVNLQALIDAARARCSAGFSLQALQCNVYLRHADHAAPVRALLADLLGDDCPSVRDAVFVQADICRRELLLEIEAHAMAPGALR